MMKLSVVTPEGPYFEGGVKNVQITAHDGGMGIFPGHVALLTELGAGALRATKENDEEEEILLIGGYLQVSNDEVSVLATRAYRRGEIDVASLRVEFDEVSKTQATGELAMRRKERDVYLLRQLIHCCQSSN